MTSPPQKTACFIISRYVERLEIGNEWWERLPGPEIGVLLRLNISKNMVMVAKIKLQHSTRPQKFHLGTEVALISIL